MIQTAPMTQLNRMTDAAAARFRALYVPPPGEPWTPFRAQRNALFRGLLAHRDGDAATVRTHLRAAAAHGVQRWQEGRLGAATGNTRLLDFEATLMPTVAVGDAALRRRLAEIPQETWLRPETVRDLRLAEAFLRLVQVGADAPVEPLSAASAPAPGVQLTHPWDWAGPLDLGIAAVLNRDQPALTDACRALLQAHAAAATAGDWQRVPEGLIALWALALEAVARRHGLSCDLRSPYLPLAALGDPPPAADRGPQPDGAGG